MRPVSRRSCFMAPTAVLKSIVFLPRETVLVAPPAAAPAHPAARRAAPRLPELPPPVSMNARRFLVPPPPPAVPSPSRPVLKELAIPPPQLVAPLPAPVLPAAATPAPPAVRTNVFAAAPAAPLPPVSVPQRPQHAGFDQTAASLTLPATPAGNPVAASGFEQTVTSRSVAMTASVETGAFGQAAFSPAGAPRGRPGRVVSTGLDQPRVAVAALPPPQGVRKGGFDEMQPSSAPAVSRSVVASARVSPVEVLEKPRPAYTQEARSRRIKGTVLLDVVFAASGQVRVVGVLRGLGYGLDEAAAEAARKIRFKPATEAGAPVDQRATLHVVFETTD